MYRDQQSDPGQCVAIVDLAPVGSGPTGSGTRRVHLIMTNVPPEIWCGCVDQRHKVLGTSPEADLRPPASCNRVSPRHGEIWLSRDGVWLIDLKSAAGTRVNGVWLRPNEPHKVIAGDRIRLGRTEMQLISWGSLPSQAVAEFTPPRMVEGTGEHAGFGPSSHGDCLRCKLLVLSPAEHDILLWLGRGHIEDRDIAHELSRSPNTVRTHMGSIFAKLGVHSRGQLIALLRREELLAELAAAPQSE